MKKRFSKLEDILTLLYYYFIKGIEWEEGMALRYPEVPGYIPLFKEKLEALFTSSPKGEFPQNLPEEELYSLITRTPGKLPGVEQKMRTSLSFGLKVLTILNNEYNLIPRDMPAPGKPYTVISKITAGKKREEGEYIIKDYAFDNYFYSICHEKNSLYRIEIFSTSGSLYGKKIQILIKQSKGDMDKLEAVCGVITDIYILYYHREITEKTEILPIISDIEGRLM